MQEKTRTLLEDIRTLCLEMSVPAHHPPTEAEPGAIARAHGVMAQRIEAHLAASTPDANAVAVAEIRDYLAGTVRGQHEGVPEEPRAAARALIEAHRALRQLGHSAPGTAS